MRLPALLAVGLFAGSLAAAPVPKEKERGLYFPVRVGDTWVTQATVGGRPAEMTETVTKVEEKDGVYRVTVGQDAGGGFNLPPQVFEVSAQGVAELTAGRSELKAPHLVLKLGVKEGDTWTSQLELAIGVVSKTTYTVGKEEEVEVPAGTFKAVRIDRETDTRGVRWKGTSWYAPGVGLVKSEAERSGIKSTRELKSFTPGKKDDKKDEPQKTEKKDK